MCDHLCVCDGRTDATQQATNTRGVGHVGWGNTIANLKTCSRLRISFLRLAWVKRKIHTYIKGKHPGGRNRWMGEHKCKLEDVFQITDSFKASLGEEKYTSLHKRQTPWWSETLGAENPNIFFKCMGEQRHKIIHTKFKLSRKLRWARLRVPVFRFLEICKDQYKHQVNEKECVLLDIGLEIVITHLKCYLF